MAAATTAMPAAPAPRKRAKRSPRSTEIVDLFPLQGQWTESAYFSLPETNRIVELSNGKVVMHDMPSTHHQRTLGKLYRLMSDFVEEKQIGEVSLAPLPVRLWPGKIREPDIVFMHRGHAERIKEDYWGVPDLVVEVLSPRTPQSSGTEKIDRVEKFDEYAQAGVQEYWLIDLTARVIEVHTLRDEAYHPLGRWSVGEVARSNLLEGFEAPVETVMGGPVGEGV